MGTKTVMLESFDKAANFIIRFHSCCISITKNIPKISCYPLMDGVFITAEEIDVMMHAINDIYDKIARTFLDTEVYSHRFIIRGALAYGEISHGNNITQGVSKEISADDDYKKNLLFGLPMIQAFNSEKKAPPFGVFIHESARRRGCLQGRYYQWYKDENLQNELRDNIISYFEWCKQFSNYLELEKEKAHKYSELAQEFFTNRNITNK